MANKKDVKDIITRAAESVFLRGGFQGARMQAIADTAGINKALLHYYFQTKEKLYAHILEKQFASLYDGIFNLLESDDDFDTWLKNLIHKYLCEVISRPKFVHFVLWELSGSKIRLPEMLKKVLGARGKTSSDMLQIIKNRLSSVGLDDYDPQQFLLNLLSLCIFPVVARPMITGFLNTPKIPDTQFVAMREKEIYALLMQGIFRKGDIER